MNIGIGWNRSGNFLGLRGMIQVLLSEFRGIYSFLSSWAFIHILALGFRSYISNKYKIMFGTWSVLVLVLQI